MPAGADRRADDRVVLGIRFFQGTAAEAVDLAMQGGLLVVPAAPALRALETDKAYREAMVGADIAIADSAFMVLAWNAMERDTMTRLSGLEYLVELLRREDVRRPGNTVWVMAGSGSAQRNLAWLRAEGIEVPEECVYQAPMYGQPLADEALLALLERLRPQHVVLTVGGGKQEVLGFYLKQRLNYLPAIHCIGAAIAFLSGDQVRIPMWADRFYLGWLFRVVSKPSVYGPRYWGALRLYGLLRRWGRRLPGGPVNSE